MNKLSFINPESISILILLNDLTMTETYFLNISDPILNFIFERLDVFLSKIGSRKRSQLDDL